MEKIEYSMETLEKLIVEINQKIVPAFEDLNIGILNTELLHELLSNNFKIVNKLISKRDKNDIKHIKSPEIKNEILRVISIVKIEFKEACKEITNSDIKQLIRYIKVIDGIAVERYIGSKKITDPKEIEIYNELKTIADAYNRILSKVSEQSKICIIEYGINDYLDLNPKTNKFEPSESLDYNSMIIL